MFILGFDSFCGQVFDNRIASETPERLDLMSGKYDEWKIDDGWVDYSENKAEWGYETILLATFDNTFEAGNIGNSGAEIEELQFKRRRKENLSWTTFARIAYDKQQKYYNVIDRLVDVGDYEYALVPVAGNIQGKEIIEDASVSFDNVWLCTNEDSIRLVYDVEYGDIDTITNTSEITTLENKYPYVFNTNLQYQRGTIKASLYSEKSIANRNIDIYSEKQLRANVIKELSKKKARVLKDGNGKSMLVYITSVKETYLYDMGTYGLEISYTEIGDYESSDDLERTGLLNVNISR